MIFKISSRGRTARDTADLLAHLECQIGQGSRVTLIDWSHADDARSALAGMEFMRDATRADIAFHHLVISPSRRLTLQECRIVVERITEALGAEDHARVLWEHYDKARVGVEVDHHFHLALGHIGPDLRAIDMGFVFARLEVVARTWEFEHGEPITRSRRASAVAARLRVAGRGDVAEAVEATICLELPRSMTTSAARARAERHGVVSPQRAGEIVRAAWAHSDTREAFISALAEANLVIEPGRTAGVWVVLQDGSVVGALDRLIGESRASVDARMRRSPEASSAELLAKLDRQERTHTETRARIRGKVPLEPEDLAHRRREIAAARRTVDEHENARRANDLCIRDIRARPTGFRALLSGEGRRWDERYRQLQDRSAALAEDRSLAFSRLKTLQTEFERMARDFESTRRRVIERMGPAWQDASSALDAIVEIRRVLSEAPDIVTWRGIRHAIALARSKPPAVREELTRASPTDRSPRGP